MTSPTSPTPSPPPQRHPHITLNASGENLLMSELDRLSPRPAPPPPASRPLIPPQRPPALPSPRSQASSGVPEPLQSPSVVDVSELLLPPTRSRPHPHRFRDDDSPGRSPAYSDASSRRTSWASESGYRDDRAGPFASPFDDSRAPSRAGSDDDYVNTQTVAEKYNITPSAGLLLFPEDVEKDDWLHNPDPSDKDRECDIFTKRGFVNIGGLLLITFGLLFVFIGYPVLSFARRLKDPTGGACASDPMCINVGPVPLLRHLRRGLIDPDTPAAAMTKTAADGSRLSLVFSDEFNTPGRTFYDGDDPYFQAVDLWYGVTQDLEWYDPDAVTTRDGVLEIRFDAFQSHNLNYRSGMVQSWNQMCFKGGLLEASISLPGKGDTTGFWPGFWAMGNLGRPGYASTTDGLWPYSYWDHCDAGITKNQSTADGLSFLPGMRLPACTCAGEDHPTPGRSRSAPEIDALEASVAYIGPGPSHAAGSASQSAQFAPFDIWQHPNYDYIELYDHTVTHMNEYCGGVFQQVLSCVTTLNNDWYDGKAYQTYGFEYTPGATGNIVWHVGGQKTWKMDARAVGPNGNIGQRVIPQEPMALVMNFGMANSFAQLDWPNLAAAMPARMRFDYVRIYQPEGGESVTCDPPGYETTEYIQRHLDSYLDVNKTQWWVGGGK
ncbi:MAG: hypothetical protein M1826_007533 [Phylliscum demangeonii]|nr:MAG: hypothetical protein M1826_007533 [Phylliscum demangeonii]